MMTSMFSVMPSFAVGTEFTDIAGNDCEEAVQVLAPMGVIVGYEEDGNRLFKPDQMVTRAEMTAFIMRELGNKVAVKTKTNFKDVPQDFWASGSIALANSKNIIVGFGDGTFGPDNQVTFEEAVKIIVCALGYEEDAKDMGGWPGGYLKMADKLDLLIGLEDKLTDVSAGCDRGTVAELLYNALDIELQDIFCYEYKVRSDRTLASEMGYTMFEDVIVNATETSAFNGSLQKAGYVALEGVLKQVRNGGYNMDQYLGEAVTIYASYDKRNDEYTIVSLIKSQCYCLIVLDVADLYEMSGTKLKYYVDREDPTKISSYPLATLAKDGGTLSMVYNGKIVEAKDQDYTMITSATNGFVKLIDRDEDGIYERVVVEAYQNYQVVEADVEEEMLVLENASGDQVSLQLNNSARVNLPQFSNIDTNGTALILVDLVEEDVCSIYSDVSPAQMAAGLDYIEDAESLRIIVSSDTVEGAVSQIRNKKKIDIDGKAYETDGALTTDSFEIEDEGIFYLDFNGHIAFATPGCNLEFFEFVYDGTLKDKKITLYTMNALGEKASHQIASTVRVDGKTYNMDNAADRSALASKLKIDGFHGLKKQYVVSLQTNDNDEVINMSILEGKEETGYFSRGDQRLGNYNVNYKTIIFSLPGGEAFDEDELIVLSYTSLENSKTYSFQVCDVDKNGVATVVMIYYYIPRPAEDDIAIIKSVSPIQVDGKTVLSIEMLQGGKSVTKNTKDYDQFFIPSAYEATYGGSAKIAYGAYPGQIIMYSLNAGAINNTFRLYPRTCSAAEYEKNPTYYLTHKYQTWENNPLILRADTKLHLIAGTVIEKPTKTTNLLVSSDAILEAAPTDVNVNYGSARITIVDTNRRGDVVYFGMSSDVKVGDYVVVRKHKGATRDIVVYKHFVPTPQFYQ